MSNLAQTPQLNIPDVIGSPILAGSKTFQDGEQVVDWKYCKDCL